MEESGEIRCEMAYILENLEDISQDGKYFGSDCGMFSRGRKCVGFIEEGLTHAQLSLVERFIKLSVYGKKGHCTHEFEGYANQGSSVHQLGIVVLGVSG